MHLNPSPGVGKVCPQCQSPIHGRADKKFCNDACRSAHNNIKYADYNSHVRKVNQRLRSNHRVLDELLTLQSETWVSEAQLLNAGFQFQFYTHVYLHPDGALFKMVYDYCYAAMEHSTYYVCRKLPEHLTVGKMQLSAY